MRGGRAAVALALALLIGSASARAEAAQAILFLGGTRPALDDARLLDAVAVYTRDLRLEVHRRPGAAPAEVTAQSLGAVVALVRGEQARLAFWYVVRPAGDTVLYAVGLDGERPLVSALPVAGGPGPELDRALALKLRAILTGAAQDEPRIATPEPVAVEVKPQVSPRPELKPSPSPTPSPSPSPSPTPSPSPVSRGAVPSPSPLAPAGGAWLGAAGYWLTVPSSGDFVRHGVALEAARRLRGAFEVHAGLEVSTGAELVGATGIGTLSDFPLRVGARVLFRRGRVTVGLGPVAALHVLSASGLAREGGSGEALRFGGGLGGELLARVGLRGHMSADLRVLVERTLPHTRFLIEGAPVLDQGAVLFGVGVGLSFGVP
ncbi:MAG: hypothetical protein IT370_07250 [Deltaproteobacteria bacterium]|nr:hypothetical protein [Deltaproteobacteria bacterium]